MWTSLRSDRLNVAALRLCSRLPRPVSP